MSYKGHAIRVENHKRGLFFLGLAGERLIIDGQLQDERNGITNTSRLSGTIKNGDGTGEHIKVSLGGMVRVQCHIFVNDVAILTS